MGLNAVGVELCRRRARRARSLQVEVVGKQMRIVEDRGSRKDE